MKNILKIIVIGALLFATGCVSVYTHHRWKKQKKDEIIRLETDGDKFLVGVDMFSLDYLKDNFLPAAGSAVADGLVFYFTIREFNIVGDNNTINVYRYDTDNKE